MGEQKTLSMMKPGAKGTIRQVLGEKSLKMRLLDMGIIPGGTVEVIKCAPFGDPIDVKVKGYHLSLRKDEAKQILIEESA